MADNGFAGAAVALSQRSIWLKYTLGRTCFITDARNALNNGEMCNCPRAGTAKKHTLTCVHTHTHTEFREAWAIDVSSDIREKSKLPSNYTVICPTLDGLEEEEKKPKEGSRGKYVGSGRR